MKYHVLDASQFKYWNRLDFPTSKLYEDTIEKIQNGLHVVMIHPIVQEKMNQDPEYAKQIVAKINKYFEDDIRTNAAIAPDSVKCIKKYGKAFFITIARTKKAHFS